MEAMGSQKLIKYAGIFGRYDKGADIAVFLGVIKNGAVHGDNGKPQINIGNGMKQRGRSAQCHDRKSHALFKQHIEHHAAVGCQLVLCDSQCIVKICSKQDILSVCSRKMKGIDDQSEQDSDHRIRYTVQHEQIGIEICQMIDDDAQIDDTGKIRGILAVKQNGRINDRNDYQR